jgi:hypothetical protein
MWEALVPHLPAWCCVLPEVLETTGAVGLVAGSVVLSGRFVGGCVALHRMQAHMCHLWTGGAWHGMCAGAAFICRGCCAAALGGCEPQERLHPTRWCVAHCLRWGVSLGEQVCMPIEAAVVKWLLLQQGSACELMLQFGSNGVLPTQQPLFVAKEACTLFSLAMPTVAVVLCKRV